MLQYNELYIKHITGERGSMLNFIRGFCMALADSVPGVSGGTVAFLLGFYDKFIMSLDHLMSGTKEERIEAIKFLIRIGIGWVVGMGAAVSVLASIFDDRIYEISSLFLGLIIFAIPMICKEEKDSLKGKYQNPDKDHQQSRHFLFRKSLFQHQISHYRYKNVAAGFHYR